MQNMNKKKQGQSFLDLVVQQSGSFEEIINAAVLNDMSLTEHLSIGTQVKNKNIKDPDNVNILNQSLPATALRGDVDDLTNEGIGFWAIEQTLIISEWHVVYQKLRIV